MLNQVIVFFEIITIVIIMFSMALIADKFLIPTLTNIAKRYSLSEQVEGILLAIGSSLPEFTTNLIASISDNVDIGIGVIAGSGSYDFTICFAFASLFTTGMTLNAILYYRDSVVYLITLGLLTYFLFDQKIQLYEAVILTCLWPIYIIISLFSFTNGQSINQHQHQQQQLNNNEEIDNNIITPNQEEIKDAHLIANKTEIVIIDINDNKETTESNNKIQSNAAPNYIDINDENNIDNGKANQEYEKDFLEEEHSLLLHSLSALETNKTLSNDEENESGLFYYCKQFYEQSRNFYSYFIPFWIDWPICGFLIIMLFIFLHSNLIVFLIQNMSNRLNISETFLGMTIISWGGNIGDTINACVAAKINANDLITTSILGSQITNLQLCLGFPWLVSIIKRKIQGLPTSDIIFNSEGKSNPLFYFIPLFICILSSMIIFGSFKMNLNKWSGGLLALVYVSYFVYESYIQTY